MPGDTGIAAATGTPDTGFRAPDTPAGYPGAGPLRSTAVIQPLSRGLPAVSAHGGYRPDAEYCVLMESRGLIEFRYGDGQVVTGDYAEYASGYLTKGDLLEYDGVTWSMYDREDRGGVTVHLFSPEESDAAPEGLRARKRRR
jgi:hypothetical protein